jgi:hypothetical protein
LRSMKHLVQSQYALLKVSTDRGEDQIDPYLSAVNGGLMATRWRRSIDACA